MPRYRDINVKAFPVVGWFSRNCKALREAYGMTQSQFSKMCGTTQAYWSSIEGLKANPGIEVVAQVAAKTGATVAYLVSSDAKAFDVATLKPWPYEKGVVTEIFAENCLAIRTRLDLSQESFAEMCRITQAYYWAIESQESAPTLEIVSVIAAGTKTTPAQLLGSRI